MALVNRPCDLCAGEDFMELYPSNIPREAQVHPGQYYSSSRQIAGHLRIVRCRSCGLVMTNPRDDAAALQAVYSALQDPVYEAESENRRRNAIDHLRWMEQYRPQPGKLLDVGCATGIFLEVAQQAGWSVTGVEPSAWSVEHARRRLPGVPITQAVLEQVDFPAQSFDVITLWDVLEHVDSPTQALLKVRSWLKDGGILLMNLPNADSLSARLFGSRWVLLLREHLWYFSPATIETLFGKTGFQALKVERNWVYFSLDNILKRLAQYSRLDPVQGWAQSPRLGPARRWPVPGSSLKKVTFRFPMGEMRVSAKAI